MQHYQRRRKKCLTLVEELSLRSRNVVPLMKLFAEKSQRMDWLRQRIDHLGENHGSPMELRRMRSEYRHLILTSKRALPRFADVARILPGLTENSKPSSDNCRAAICDWWSRSLKNIATVA